MRIHLICFSLIVLINLRFCCYLFYLRSNTIEITIEFTKKLLTSRESVTLQSLNDTYLNNTYQIALISRWGTHKSLQQIIKYKILLSLEILTYCFIFLYFLYDHKYTNTYIPEKRKKMKI